MNPGGPSSRQFAYRLMSTLGDPGTVRGDLHDRQARREHHDADANDRLQWQLLTNTVLFAANGFMRT
jgi:hypothetical protein